MAPRRLHYILPLAVVPHWPWQPAAGAKGSHPGARWNRQTAALRPMATGSIRLWGYSGSGPPAFEHLDTAPSCAAQQASERWLQHEAVGETLGLRPELTAGRSWVCPPSTRMASRAPSGSLPVAVGLRARFFATYNSARGGGRGQAHSADGFQERLSDVFRSQVRSLQRPRARCELMRLLLA